MKLNRLILLLMFFFLVMAIGYSSERELTKDQSAHISGTLQIILHGRNIDDLNIQFYLRDKVSARTIGESILSTSMSTISFTIEFDPKAIDQNREYNLDIIIIDKSDENRVISKHSYPVQTNGHPSSLNIAIQPIPRR